MPSEGPPFDPNSPIYRRRGRIASPEHWGHPPSTPPRLHPLLWDTPSPTNDVYLGRPETLATIRFKPVSSLAGRGRRGASSSTEEGSTEEGSTEEGTPRREGRTRRGPYFKRRRISTPYTTPEPKDSDSDSNVSVIFIREKPPKPECGGLFLPSDGEDSVSSVKCMGTPPARELELVVLSDSSEEEDGGAESEAGPPPVGSRPPSSSHRPLQHSPSPSTPPSTASRPPSAAPRATRARTRLYRRTRRQVERRDGESPRLPVRSRRRQESTNGYDEPSSPLPRLRPKYSGGRSNRRRTMHVTRDDEVDHRSLHSRRSKLSQVAPRTSPRLRRSPRNRDKPKGSDKPRADDKLGTDADVEDIEQDEPERFQTQGYLRQLKAKDRPDLERLKAKRRAKQLGLPCSDSLDHQPEKDVSMWDIVSTDGSEGDDVAHFFTNEEILEPAQRAEAKRGIDELRSLKQELEFHFKVVFQYLVYLAIQGPGILPLRRKDKRYFGHSLKRLRTQHDHLRCSIRGTLWEPRLSALLEKYPTWGQEEQMRIVHQCNVCRRTTKQSPTHQLWVGGQLYDKHTYEALCDEDEDDGGEVEDEDNDENEDEGEHKDQVCDEDQEEDESLDGSEDEKGEDAVQRHIVGPVGAFCKARAKQFHRLAHWEYRIFRYVQRCHRRLLRVAEGCEVAGDTDSSRDEDHEGYNLGVIRRKSRVLLGSIGGKDAPLPDDPNDPNKVVEWMDAHGFLENRFAWVGEIQNVALKLESSDHC